MTIYAIVAVCFIFGYLFIDFGSSNILVIKNLIHQLFKAHLRLKSCFIYILDFFVTTS